MKACYLQAFFFHVAALHTAIEAGLGKIFSALVTAGSPRKSGSPFNQLIKSQITEHERNNPCARTPYICCSGQ